MKVSVLSAAEVLWKSPTPPLAVPSCPPAVAKADPATSAAVLWLMGGGSPVSKAKVGNRHERVGECLKIIN